MTEKQFNRRLNHIRKKQKEYEQKIQLEAEEKKCKPEKSKLSMTKKITVYLFIVLNILLIYSGVAMWHFADLSYLGALITDVIGQIIVFITYSAKAVKENTVGGITYDTAMQNRIYENNEDYFDEVNEEETNDNEIYG